MAKCVMRVQKKKSRLKGVIVLVGNPNVGKSTTLINLSKILLDEEDAFFYYELKKQKKSKDRRIVLRTDRWIVGIGTADKIDGTNTKAGQTPETDEYGAYLDDADNSKTVSVNYAGTAPGVAYVEP